MLDIESADPAAKPEITKSLETNLAGLEKKRKTLTGKMTNFLPCPVCLCTHNLQADEKTLSRADFMAGRTTLP
ncbi:hypothetical protein TNCV_529891 [Trichonephila clavipes]|nr:hypothetical protein TNCV_529891 [Trichonephila clavipes]